MKDSRSDLQRLEFPPTCHPTTVALYEYWLGTCGDRRMPMRSNIDPTNMPRRVLPGISIVEVVQDDRRYVYRLIGTGEVEVRGNDPTGKSVLEGFFGPSAEDALDLVAVVSGCYGDELDAAARVGCGQGLDLNR